MESKMNCPECGCEFTVLTKMGTPITEEFEGGLKVRVRCTLGTPRFCPWCGHDFDVDFEKAVRDSVRRMRG